MAIARWQFVLKTRCCGKLTYFAYGKRINPYGMNDDKVGVIRVSYRRNPRTNYSTAYCTDAIFGHGFKEWEASWVQVAYAIFVAKGDINGRVVRRIGRPKRPTQKRTTKGTVVRRVKVKGGSAANAPKSTRRSTVRVAAR